MNPEIFAMAGQADSLISVLFALCADSAIVVTRGVAAYPTKSGAMLANAPTMQFEPDMED